VNAWKRDGRKRWSSWDQLSYAALSADERAKLGPQKRALTTEERGQRLWNQMWKVVGLVGLIGALVVLGFAIGRKPFDALFMAVYGVAAVIILVSPMVGEPRVLLRLCRERVKEPQRLAARAADVARGPELVQSYKTVVERRALAASQLQERTGCLTAIAMARAHPASAKCAALAMMMFFGMSRPAERILEHYSPPLEVLVILSPIALLIAAVWIYHRARKRLLQAIDGVACPDCGYPLASIPAAAPPPEGQTGTIGPERCPECGCPWPLVAPAKGDRVLQVD
jgi:hypothetical protein